MKKCVRTPCKQVAFWNNSNDLRIDKMSTSNMKKIAHKTGKWQINRWCHIKNHKVNEKRRKKMLIKKQLKK